MLASSPAREHQQSARGSSVIGWLAAWCVFFAVSSPSLAQRPVLTIPDLPQLTPADSAAEPPPSQSQGSGDSRGGATSSGPSGTGGNPAAEPWPTDPATPRFLPGNGDWTGESLAAEMRDVLAASGGTALQIPLAVKAQFLEDVLWRYHLAPSGQVHYHVYLPSEPDWLPDYRDGADVSTWNGALLAAMSFKYAVTRDAVTLERLRQLVHGLHLFQEASGVPGLLARCVVESPQPRGKCVYPYTRPDGRQFHVRTDPAKGTYNQVLAGYAALMMFAWRDLPPHEQILAQEDLKLLCLHLISRGYEIYDRDGKRTEFGDLRPLFGSRSVPFNAQVAYFVASTAHHFAADNPAVQDRFSAEFHRLRTKHHVYYEDPLRYLVVPQRVGANPLVKGMNDRNHVMSAAFYSIMIELDRTHRSDLPAEGKFLFEMGQSMDWTMRRIAPDRNALCNFMWLGLLNEPGRFQWLAGADAQRIAGEFPYLLADAVEQLRRFPVDRFSYPGTVVETGQPQWMDVRNRHDAFCWKSDPTHAYQVTDYTTSQHTCSIDFLYAYWVMRFFRLDERLPGSGEGLPTSTSP